MKTPDLLTCPFCGGDASDAGQIQYLIPLSEMKWEDGSPITEGFFCNCPACGVTNNVLGVGYQTQAKAIAAWNRRAPTPLAAALAVPEVRALVDAATAVADACGQARMMPRAGCGAGGQTIEANIRGSVYHGVAAWPVEEMLTALAALKGGE